MNLKDTMDYRTPLKHPQAILFLTVSGSHLYGFDSPDSDYDLRGAHLCRTKDVLSLSCLGLGQETYRYSEPKGPGSEEIVTFEAEKFIGLMVKNGGNLLEQVLSPHLVFTSLFHEKLKELAPKVISKRHLAHYLGFAGDQIALMKRRPDKETKIFLYIFRTLLSGIHAARFGEVEANLSTLLDRNYFEFEPTIRELIAWKRQTKEENALYHEFSPTRLWRMVNTLEDELKSNLEETRLPDQTPVEVIRELNLLLLDARETIGR